MSKQIERSAIIPFDKQRMYQLVNDVEAYPQYMPGCIGAEILESTDSSMQARLDLSKSGFKQSFVTKNTLVPGESISLSLLEGPFKRFEGLWLFETLGEGDGCKITFKLTFEFSNPILAFAASKAMESVASDQVDAVIKRAYTLYDDTKRPK